MNRSTRQLLMAFAATVLLAGCAEIPQGVGSDPKDPFEEINRHTTAFNNVLDDCFSEPVARTYNNVFPEFFRQRVTNVYNNLGEPINFVNNLLQGKIERAGVSLARFLLNSTLGLAGMFDVAGDTPNMEIKSEDFSQTLATWGVPDGPYLVVPALGPMVLRDVPGRFVDFLCHPITYADNGIVHWSYADDPVLKWVATGWGALDLRARLLKGTELLKDAVDPYVMVREAYIANRRNAVYDGNPPLQLTVDEFEDEDEKESLVKQKE